MTMTTVVEIQTGPQDIGEQLGLRGTDEQWFGVGRLWAFTRVEPGLGQGFTIYVRPGADVAAVKQRWQEKLAEVEK